MAGSKLVLAFSLAVACGAAQEAAKVEVKFEKSFDAAYARAKAENRPVLFCIMKEEEIACKRMLGNIYTDSDVRRKMGDFVLVPCSISALPTFEGVAPAEHQACERAMRENYQSENLVIAPQHIITGADGKVITKKAYEITSAKKFIEFLDRGLLLFIDPSKAAESQPAADSRPAPDGKPVPKPRSAEIDRVLNLLLKATGAEKERLAKDLLSDAENVERQEAFLEAVAKTRESKEKGVIVRAVGYQEYSAAAPALIKLLEEKDAHLRNCAVVTLEEMANPAAALPLLALYRKEKEAEIKKDCVRAFGPCAAGNAEVREILLKELTSSSENMRCGAAMSLGMFVPGDEPVQKAFKSRYEKETLKGKTAILWALGFSGDVSMADLIEAFQKDENNLQLKTIGDAMRRQLGDPDAPAAPTGGGGGGGGGRKGGGGGARGPWGVMKLLAPLYTDDKIMRNRVREIMERGRGA
jgi:hypothetical protein